MKLGQLIKKLEAMKKKHGNVDVSVIDTLALTEGFLEESNPRFALTEGPDGKVTSILLVDKETFESLS